MTDPIERTPSTVGEELIERPTMQPPRKSDKPEWQQVNDLFERYGLASPDWRFRDELVGWLVWARYGEARLSDKASMPDEDEADDGTAYQEGFEDGRSEARGAAVELWGMVQRWAIASKFIEEPDSDGLTAQELMDAVLVGFGERKPPRRRAVSPPADELREALKKLRAYNVDIEAGRINYRPRDHITVIDAALQNTSSTC